MLQYPSASEDASSTAAGTAAAALRLAEPYEIFACLAKIGHDPDARLSPLQRAESLAYTALIEEQLQVALLYALWEEAKNYAPVVRPALADTPVRAAWARRAAV